MIENSAHHGFELIPNVPNAHAYPWVQAENARQSAGKRRRPDVAEVL